MVVLTPANITLTIAMSWLPTPVYLVFEENGAMNVQPASVSVRFEHFVKYTFLRRALTARLATNQKDSGYCIIDVQYSNLVGTKEKTL